MCLSAAQWFERQTGIREVMGLNPVGDTDFQSCRNEHFTVKNSHLI